MKKYIKIAFGMVGGFFLFLFVVGLFIEDDTTSRESSTYPENQVTVSNKPIQYITYDVLREWKPFEKSSNLGMDILIKPEDVSELNIENLLKHISSPVSEKTIVRVFSSKRAWELVQDSNSDLETEAYLTGYIAYYVNNKVNGAHEILWTQNKGVLQELNGETTEL